MSEVTTLIHLFNGELTGTSSATSATTIDGLRKAVERLTGSGRGVRVELPDTIASKLGVEEVNGALVANDSQGRVEIAFGRIVTTGQLLHREVVMGPVDLSGWYRTNLGRWARVEWDAGRTKVREVRAQLPDAADERAADLASEADRDAEMEDSRNAVEVPKTKVEAIEALAALDAARWGEPERDASRRINAGRSYGLLLNALARRPEYEFGDAVPHLVAAAKAALTDDDRARLRKGG